MIYLAILLAIPMLVGLTFALFIVESEVDQAYGLHWLAKVLLVPWLWIGFGLDVVLNATLASLAFLELPRQWTLSARVRRHLHGRGWRKRLAKWICDSWLRPVDPGHCR